MCNTILQPPNIEIRPGYHLSKVSLLVKKLTVGHKLFTATKLVNTIVQNGSQVYLYYFEKPRRHIIFNMIDANQKMTPILQIASYYQFKMASYDNFKMASDYNFKMASHYQFKMAFIINSKWFPSSIQNGFKN